MNREAGSSASSGLGGGVGEERTQALVHEAWVSVSSPLPPSPEPQGHEVGWKHSVGGRERLRRGPSRQRGMLTIRCVFWTKLQGPHVALPSPHQAAAFGWVWSVLRGPRTRPLRGRFTLAFPCLH